MSEENRYFITRITRRKTQAGADVVDLYAGGKDSKLQYPVLTLFDLAELAVVGIDPNTLNSEQFHCRFWAYYQVSEKETSEGNPYKDVIYLEPIAPVPGPNAADDTERILNAMRILYKELAKIREAVQAIQAGKTGTTTSPPQAAAPTTPEPAEPLLPEGQVRDLFYALIGQAIATHIITAQEANELTKHANGEGGWGTAYTKLRDKIEQRETNHVQ